MGQWFVSARPWDFSVRQLHVFVTVVHLGSVTHASEQLHVTQPAVSKMIRNMESALDAALFQREGRKLVLTAVGEMVYRHALSAIAEFRAGATELEALKESNADVVRVFGIPAVMPVLVPRAIARMREHHPGAQVVVSGDVYYGIADILEGVAKGDADVGITVFQEEIGHGTLTARWLYGDRLYAFAQRDHPLAESGNVEISQLMDELIVMPPLDTFAGRILVQEFSAVGLPFPPQRVLAANRQVTTGLVRECNAVAFVTTHPACEELRDEGLVRLPVNFRQPVPWNISICQRASATPSPALEVFLQCLEDLVREAEAREALAEDA